MSDVKTAAYASSSLGLLLCLLAMVLKKTSLSALRLPDSVSFRGNTEREKDFPSVACLGV